MPEVARLQSMKAIELKSLLNTRHLLATGLKKDLVTRLINEGQKILSKNAYKALLKPAIVAEAKYLGLWSTMKTTQKNDILNVFMEQGLEGL